MPQYSMLPKALEVCYTFCMCSTLPLSNCKLRSLLRPVLIGSKGFISVWHISFRKFDKKQTGADDPSVIVNFLVCFLVHLLWHVCSTWLEFTNVILLWAQFKLEMLLDSYISNYIHHCWKARKLNSSSEIKETDWCSEFIARKAWTAHCTKK